MLLFYVSVCVCVFLVNLYHYYVFDVIISCIETHVILRDTYTAMLVHTYNYKQVNA